MSLTLNMVGGGGGGLSATDALLRVQAPAGSTVTITKGTTTKSDLGHENADEHTVYDYYFIIHQSQFDSVNPWTVTATLNGQTATATIVINAADEYDLNLTYVIYFVHSGELIEQDWTLVNSTDGITTEGSAQRFRNGATSRSGVYATTNKVDLTNKNTLTITITGGNSYFSTGKAPIFGIGAARPTSTPSSGAGTITNFDSFTSFNGTGDITAGTYTLDVSSFSGEYYVAIALSSNNQTRAYVDVTEFYLS